MNSRYDSLQRVFMCGADCSAGRDYFLEVTRSLCSIMWADFLKAEIPFKNYLGITQGLKKNWRGESFLLKYDKQ